MTRRLTILAMCLLSACGPGPETKDGSGGGGATAGTTSTSTTSTTTGEVACGFGMADCDEDPLNGCEANLYTDPANCGECGKNCLKGSCDGGEKCMPFDVASGSGETFNAVECAVSGSSMYWLQSVGDSIGVASSNDASLLTPPIENKGGGSIAVDDASLFWTNGWGEVLTMPKSGGDITILASGQQWPLAVAVDDTHVFWTQWIFDQLGSVARVPKNGGAAQMLHMPEDLGQPQQKYVGIFVDSTYVYWLDSGSGNVMLPARIWRIEKDGSSAKPLAEYVPVGGDYHCFRGDSNSLYWAEDSGAVWMLPKSGGAPTKIAGLLGRCTGMAVDGQSVFVAEEIVGPNGASDATGRLVRINPVTMEMLVISTEPHPATCVAAGTSLVYWMLRSPDGAIGSVRAWAK